MGSRRAERAASTGRSVSNAGPEHRRTATYVLGLTAQVTVALSGKFTSAPPLPPDEFLMPRWARRFDISQSPDPTIEQIDVEPGGVPRFGERLESPGRGAFDAAATLEMQVKRGIGWWSQDCFPAASSSRR